MDLKKPLQFISNSETEASTLAASMLSTCKTSRIFAFYGELGAGKTTLIKALCQKIGVSEKVSSPTFAIVNEYHCAEGPVYHFDFYRIKSPAELFEIGFEEYIEQGAYVFMEWPEKIGDFLPSNIYQVHIKITGKSQREYEIYYV